jgi:hypothetical protein
MSSDIYGGKASHIAYTPEKTEMKFDLKLTEFVITFLISAFVSGSPIIVDIRQALEANIARTLEGQTESVLSNL